MKRGTHLLLVALLGSIACSPANTNYQLAIRQVTEGPNHHFFGYIGQSKTIPWNESGRYILGLQTDFHDRLPGPDDPANIVLIDAHNDFAVQVLDETRGWNHQQGTMFYWNPQAPESQFFFNDRDTTSGKIFTALFDIDSGSRIKEFRSDDHPVANGGVAPDGNSFAAINYARMARLRPVTGYQGTLDWTEGIAAPDDDGIFLVDTETGEMRLVVSFAQMADALRPEYPMIDEIPLFINHTLWNRTSDLIWFFARGNWSRSRQAGLPRINTSFTIRLDGSDLTMHEHIGGHPEWGEGNAIYGVRDDRQILYDIEKQTVVKQLGTLDVFPDAEGDIALSPDGRYIVNGYDEDGFNYYVVYRLEDGYYAVSEGLSRGTYTRGDLRIDPAPRWNRTSDAILVPGWTDEGTRQMHVIELIGGSTP